MDFSGKRVLVTGGTRGIGRGIVEGFLAAGARVAINGSSPESVKQARDRLGPEVVAAPGSVATVPGCREVVDQAVAGLGGLDVLVNNAGASSRRTSIDDADEEHWNRVVDTNLKGTFFCIKFALPALREGRGNVVNISSTWGIKGAPFASTYCASKAGVVNPHQGARTRARTRRAGQLHPARRDRDRHVAPHRQPDGRRCRRRARDHTRGRSDRADR